MNRILLLLFLTFVSPQPSPTDWLTYRNTKHHYQIEYPPTYTPRQCSEEKDLVLQDDICIEKHITVGKDPAWVAFSIQVNPQNKFGPLDCVTEEDCITQWKRVFENDKKDFTDFEKDIAGRKVKGFSLNQKFDTYTSKLSVFFMLKDKKTFFISVSQANIKKQNQKASDEEVDKMLSTFAFTGD
jgi:hypothetical protein